MSERSETFVIETSQPGGRLDVYLAARYPAVSRGTLQRLIEEGYIQVNGQRAKPSHSPRAGEVVSVHFPEPRPSHVYPEALPLDILFEDEHLVVVNKAPGMVVHPGPGNEEHTLVNALLHHCAGRLSGIAGVARPGIVHRLDKDTSGCLVVAKNDAAHLGLSAQFSGRQVAKLYHAVACGEIPREGGILRTAIARHPTHRKRMAVVDEDVGREAVTEYRVRERLRGATLVEARIHTGRTHQIRVHFQYLGHPLAGDATYGKRPTARLAEATGYTPPRVLLHAWELSFVHPVTGGRLTFHAPWPEDFAEAVQALGGTSRY
ncbi:RluA family pseudouridine synthase [Fontisphaera persica]|uniref:RluA family pseudouridine synthase n=1 Tax=Fontisphaera persica TaxID=2974023 RepID=UPI0024BF1E97|nr:RluA family pseudouridine synthase [Fontisphaera persica]WCJ59991.1 RluA family pseudouridine synthase [Fontisphaera persica]